MDEPRRDERKQLSILFDLEQAAQLSHTLVARSLEHIDLDGPGFALYSLLVARGPLTVTEVAEDLGVPVARASRDLQAVDRRGHLLRERNSKDGRSYLVSLTDDGVQLHEEARREFTKMLLDLEARLGPAMGDIRWSLQTIVDAMKDAMAGEPSKSTEPLESHQLEYRGRPLEDKELASVRQFIEFLQHSSAELEDR